MKQLFHTLVIVLCISGLNACNSADKPANPEESNATSTLPAPAPLHFNVLNVYPHDTTSYTQGLLVNNGQLMESTGSPEYSHYKSWVGTIDLSTGKAKKKVPLDTSHFGEGIAVLKNKLYQLTWTSNKGFVYDLATLKMQREFPIKTQGWGITTDSTYLIMSDGSSNLYYLNPDNFTTVKVLGVNDNNGPVNNLNELEFINGFIYANKYQSDYILKIDPSNGHVVGRADLTGLLQNFGKENMNQEKYSNGEAVLNGIAYDPATGKIYITGKLWPKLFEINLQ